MSRFHPPHGGFFMRPAACPQPGAPRCRNDKAATKPGVSHAHDDDRKAGNEHGD
jgi:hypothetical protein